MLAKSLPVLATLIAFLGMIATSHAQSSSRSFAPAPQPFANCPNCQLNAARAQSTANVFQAQPTFTSQSYAAPVQMPQPIQVARPIQYATPLQYSAPQVSNYAPVVTARPVYNTPVYRALVYQAPAQAYRPVYRNYAPAIHSGCSGY